MSGPAAGAESIDGLDGIVLGFVGTGTITASIVTGLCGASGTSNRIWLSPRNADVAARLAATCPQATVADSNQQVLDRSDVVFLAVRPQIAYDVIRELRFRPEHRVISLVATFSRDRIATLVAPAAAVSCAVPQPTVAARLGPTVIFPADPVAKALFGRLGMAFEAGTERELHARGALASGERFRHLSILDTVFECRIADTCQVGGIPAVVPEIGGRAWLTGVSHYGVDPDDPFPSGYRLADTWFA